MPRSYDYRKPYLSKMDGIDPCKVISFLEESPFGWKLFPRHRDDIKIYQYKKEDGTLIQANIPLEKSLIDYREAMLSAMEEISLVEEKPIDDLISMFSCEGR